MAKNILQLNYDELTTIAKKFKDEGEDMVKLHSATRQRVRDLYKEWIGEAANKFFDEMENELLPALQRLATALFFSQDVVRDIMKIVHDTDEETATFFKGNFSRDDFGASGFQSALGGMGGASGPDDFGAGKFDEALGGISSSDSSGSDDFGAGQFEEARPSQAGEPASGQGAPEQSGQPAEGQMATEPMTGGAGGGNGSSSGQGMQGDLNGMGVGSSQAQQGVAGGEVGRSGAMADHVYSGSGASDSSSGESQAPAGGSSPAGGGQSSSGGGQAAAAGAAGVAGAAAVGGAAKVVKDQKEKDD